MIENCINLKFINQHNDYNKLNQINDNYLKYPLMSFNLYFKSKHQIKEQLIQILNSLKIKNGTDKKN